MGIWWESTETDGQTALDWLYYYLSHVYGGNCLAGEFLWEISGENLGDVGRRIFPGEVSRTWLRQKQMDRQLLTGYTITSAMSGVGIVWRESFSGKMSREKLGACGVFWGKFVQGKCPGPG